MELITQSYGLNFLCDYLHLLQHNPFIKEDRQAYELYNKLCDRISDLLSVESDYKLVEMAVVGVVEKDT